MNTRTVTLLICGTALAAAAFVLSTYRPGSSSGPEGDWWDRPEFDEPGAGDVIDPQDYVSKSGRFSLHVAPSQRLGVGPGFYRMTKEGREL